MEQSLFNLASTSHPHAPCVGLLAFMHPDAARHHVSGLVYRHRAVLWECVCVCVCVCVREKKTRLHNGWICVYDVPAAFRNSFMSMHTHLSTLPLAKNKIMGSDSVLKWDRELLNECDQVLLISSNTGKQTEVFLGQSALEKQNKQAPDLNKTPSLRLRAALWAKRWRQHDNMLRMEMITSSLVDVGPVTIVDLIREQISYETIKMAAGKKKTALCR